MEAIQKIYAAEGRSSADARAIVGALGYSGMSGNARSKLAVLKQFGLLEDVADNKMRLSSRAIQLANLRPSDTEYASAIRAAALAPALFREFQEKSPEASDRNLEIQLTTSRGFSPDGARKAIKAYRDTLRFAKVGFAGYNGSGGEANDNDDDYVEPPDYAVLRAQQMPPPEDRSGSAERRDSRNRDAVTYSWPLEDADKVDVTFAGNPGKKPTRRDLDALIDYLELIRKRTPEARQADEESGS
ncbi:MAG TPA: hypothetical protein VIW78_09945 [Burkholderiales bacterium]